MNPSTFIQPKSISVHKQKSKYLFIATVADAGLYFTGQPKIQFLIFAYSIQL